MVFGICCLLLVANAGRRGFLRESSLVVGLVAALWLAGQALPSCASALRGRQPVPGPQSSISAWRSSSLIVSTGASSLTAPVFRRGPLLTLDRIAGLGVGLAEAAMLVGLLAMVGNRSRSVPLARARTCRPSRWFRRARLGTGFGARFRLTACCRRTYSDRRIVTTRGGQLRFGRASR